MVRNKTEDGMLAEQPHRRFTADEVARMVEAGILAEDEPIGGEYHTVRFHGDGEPVPVAGHTLSVGELLP